MKTFPIAALFLALSLSTPALADWSVTGAHITIISAYDFPTTIDFHSDVVPKNCPDYGLSYNGKGSDTSTKQKNMGAIYSMLLAAKLSKSPV